MARRGKSAVEAFDLRDPCFLCVSFVVLVWLPCASASAAPKAPLWRADDGLPPTPPEALLLNVLCRKPLELLLLLLFIAIVLRTLRAKLLRSGLSDGRLAAMMATLTSMAVTMGRTTHVLCVECLVSDKCDSRYFLFFVRGCRTYNGSWMCFANVMRMMQRTSPLANAKKPSARIPSRKPLSTLC